MTTRRMGVAIMALAVLPVVHTSVLLAADKQMNPLLSGVKLGTVTPLQPGDSGSAALAVGSDIYLDAATTVAAPGALAAALPADKTSGVFAFASGVNPVSGSIKLGVVLAGLDAAVKAGDLERCRIQGRNLLSLLRELGAPEATLLACCSLQEVFKDGDLAAARKAGLPVLRPVIDGFVSQEGRLVYFRLGQWAEATRLVVTASTADAAKTMTLVRQFDGSSFFAGQKQTQDLPKGAVEALSKIAQIQKLQTVDGSTLAELRTALNAFLSFAL